MKTATVRELRNRYTQLLKWIEAGDISAYEAAELSNALRRELVGQRESFAFETGIPRPGR